MILGVLVGATPPEAVLQEHQDATEDRAEALPGPYLAVPPHYVKAFPEYLRAAGYYTTNNVKTDYQFGTPFTIWDESGNNAHWRNRPDPDQPFFAVFNFNGTHESQVWADSPARRGKPLVTDPARVVLPPYYPDTRAVREDMARHYDNVADMDAWARNLLRQLEEDGLLENTIVFFWTDHGDGLPRAKRALYDSGLHVPLVVRWPGRIRPGTVSDELVSLIDLAPTVLSLAGVPIPAHMQGRALLGPMAGAAAPQMAAMPAGRVKSRRYALVNDGLSVDLAVGVELRQPAGTLPREREFATVIRVNALRRSTECTRREAGNAHAGGRSAAESALAVIRGEGLLVRRCRSVR